MICKRSTTNYLLLRLIIATYWLTRINNRVKFRSLIIIVTYTKVGKTTEINFRTSGNNKNTIRGRGRIVKRYRFRV